MRKNLSTGQSGFTLVEILVSITMVVIFAMAVFPIISWLTVRSRQFQYSTQAGELLQEGMEATYNVMLSTSNWGDFADGMVYHPAVDTTGGSDKWSLELNEEQNLETRFKRRITMSSICRNKDTGEVVDCIEGSIIDNSSRRVTVWVGWIENQADKHVQAQLFLTKIQKYL